MTTETSAATQLLYGAADGATETGRVLLFAAIHRLTGLPLAVIVRNWHATR